MDYLCRLLGGKCVVAFLIAGFLGVAVTVTAADPRPRIVALENATIFTGTGQVIERGTVLIKGGKIAAAGREVKLPPQAERRNLKGAAISPGLIDCWSGWAESSDGSADPTRRAEDAFDRYNTHNLRELLAAGVTSLYLTPAGSPGVDGLGAVIRLAPSRDRDVAYGQVEASGISLVIDLGSSAKPIARLKTLQSVENLFRDALEHRKKLEEYGEKLREYAAALDKTSNKVQVKPKPGTKPADAVEADSKSAGDSNSADKTEEKKPQKPARPPRNPKLDIVLKAIDREIPVRVVAHRSSEILSAIELADRFSFDLIIEGASEAHLVADQLVEAGVTVVLGPQDRAAHRRDDARRRWSPKLTAALDQAGVRWVVGSGDAASLRTRFLLMNAQLASGDADALQRVTSDAAEVLRLDDRLGRLQPGFLADLVVWSGDPLDPTSKVLQVYVGGELVYEALQAEQKGGAS